MSITVTIKQLLEAGVHFGHQTKRWNPKMSQFIFAERNGIHIVNLEKTLAALTTACEFLRQAASEGKLILLVGTKKQAQEVIKQVAEATEMPYVNQRWLGGMLTNFETVRKSIHRLEQIENMEEEGTYQFITKKEVGEIRKEREKLNKVLAGIRHMKKVPSVVFVIDPVKEMIAVQEARKLKIPVVALIDTNCDPDLINFPVPGNDDAIRSIKLIGETVLQSIQEGRAQFKQGIADEQRIADEKAAAESAPGFAEGAFAAVSEIEAEIAEVVEEQVVAKLDVVEEKPRVKKARAKKE